MTSCNFVGRGGTRRVFVEEIKSFLGEVFTPGYVSIWGPYGVGKSEAVTRAVEEAQALMFPQKIINRDSAQKVLIDHRYEALSPKRVAHSIATELGIEKKPRFLKNASQFNDKSEKDWEPLIDWIDKTLTSHSSGVASIVIWLSVSEPDASHDTLTSLFKGTLGRTATRKLILEQHRAHYFQLRVPEPFYCKGWKLAALSYPEAAELLHNLLLQILDDPAMLEAAKTKIISMCGTHPGLIILVCTQLESKKTAGSYYQNPHDVVKTLSDMIDEAYDLYFRPYVDLLVNSLPNSAIRCLIALTYRQSVDLLDDVKDAGILLADGRVAELIERYFKDTHGHSFIYDAFISYNSKDRAQADQIDEALRQRNVRTWIDKQKIQGGSWQEEISNAVSSSLSTVVLVSDQTLGHWQDMEVQASLTQKKPLIPVLLTGAPEPDQLPHFLPVFHCVNFRDGFSNAAFDELERAITAIKTQKRNA